VEQLLGEPQPTDDWLGPAWVLVCWTVGQATVGGDPEAGALAVCWSNIPSWLSG
jgi:hypothetical protein